VCGLYQFRCRKRETQLYRQCTYKRNIEVFSRKYCLQRNRKNCYIFWVCVCSLSHPACKAHAMYFIVICGITSSTVFFSAYVKNGTDIGKMLLNIICVFWFSLQLLSETFLVLKWIQRDIKCLYKCSYKTSFILDRFWWNLDFDTIWYI